MMTFRGEYLSALESRGMAVIAKKNAVKMKKDAELRKLDYEPVLFGDEEDYGIASIFSIIYRQIWLLSGRRTRKPQLHDYPTAVDQFKANFTTAVTPPGDREGGLYPPQIDNPDAGEDEIDPKAEWITTFDLESSASGTGVIPVLDDIIKLSGTEASNNADGRGPFVHPNPGTDSSGYPNPYPSGPPESLATQKERDRGVGILGRRTENSETIKNSEASYSLGADGIDDPDTFKGSVDLVAKLAEIQEKLNLLFPSFQEEIDLLAGAKNKNFIEFRVDLPNDTDLDSFMDEVHGAISGMADQFTYFNSIKGDTTPISRRAEINSRLAALTAYANGVKAVINQRITKLTSADVLGTEDYGCRKHLAFWVSEIASKPSGPYAMSCAADNMQVQAQVNLTKMNKRLNFFTEDHGEWLEPPEPIAIYDDAVLNLTEDAIDYHETNISWSLIRSANKFKVLSKPFKELSLPLTNDFWEDAGEWVEDATPQSFLRNYLIINPPEETTLFRFVSYDTDGGNEGDFERTDSFNTHSVQSDIVSPPLGSINVENIETGQSLLTLDDLTGLRSRDYLLLNGITISQITLIRGNQVLLDADYGSIDQIQKMSGVYFKK